MKVLVATDISQGLEDIDVFDAEEGELVVTEFCEDCGHSSGGILRGLDSGGHTTSARVVERDDLTIEEMAFRAVDEYETHVGIERLVDNNPERFELLCRDLLWLFSAIEGVELGTVVRRNGDRLYMLPPEAQ